MVRAMYALAIVAIWVLAWGSLTVANVVSGLLVAAVLMVVTPGGIGRGRRPPIRPLAVGRFLGYTIAEMVRSNVSLARDALRLELDLYPGVMAVPLPRCSDGLLTLITNVLAMTPGSNPVHVEPDPTVLYVHVLHMRDVEASRADVLHLADLAFRAFSPNPDAVRRMMEAEA
jgi:multicomponent Na+:H+ antiporter subunit E